MSKEKSFDMTSLMYNKLIGVYRPENTDEMILCIDENRNLFNHIETIHAGAIYSLAEASSAEALIRQLEREFDFSDIFVVLRSSKSKYLRPAKGRIHSILKSPKEELREGVLRLKEKGKALFSTTILIKDSEDTSILRAQFDWFVRKA